MKKRYFVYLAFVVLLALSISPLAFAGEASRDFVVDLQPLNGSGVSGMAHLTLDGDQLIVTIQAPGLEAGELHPQHIHGFEAKADSNGFANPKDSTCPTLTADADGDGLVSVGEGLPNYGPVLLPLLPFSTTPEGSLDFAATYTLPAELEPANTLQNRSIVIHGLSVAGGYVPSLPVACGQIRPEPKGP